MTSQDYAMKVAAIIVNTPIDFPDDTTACGLDYTVLGFIPQANINGITEVLQQAPDIDPNTEVYMKMLAQIGGGK